jgi:hypothetical protein
MPKRARAPADESSRDGSDGEALTIDADGRIKAPGSRALD